MQRLVRGKRGIAGHCSRCEGRSRISEDGGGVGPIEEEVEKDSKKGTYGAYKHIQVS